MKKHTLMLAFFLISFASNAGGSQVSCDDDYGANKKTCHIYHDIDDPEITLAPPSNVSINFLSIRDNKEVKYLPVNVSESLPDLVYYDAINCSITNIYRKNVQGLTFLKTLNLRYNEIETVKRDVFSDLTSLLALSLSDNKVKHIEDGAFYGLTMLVGINLVNNVCVNELIISPELNQTEIEILVSRLYIQCQLQENSQSWHYFRKRTLMLAFFLISFASNAGGSRVSCDDDYGANKKTCHIYHDIDEPEITLAPPSNVSILLLSIRDNKGVKYLPVNVSKTFPDLPHYDAINCSITNIYRNNFRGLTFLMTLNLKFNEIETVKRDVFSDLTSLITLSLSDNKVKHIEDDAFFGLSKLNDRVDSISYFRKRTLMLAFFLISFASNAGGSRVSCDDDYGANKKTCHIYHDIDEPEITLAPPSNVSILLLSIRDNKGVKYLPVNVSKTFPDLPHYDAINCSITNIYRNNFRGLTFLMTLNLKFNEIETVKRDVFSDLTSLAILCLSDNKVNILKTALSMD
ncbi:CLUMA_CG016308, isoform A [Clunio marinus]|uniref:CLUMA_CG016308, isoform A n=1 Tax=Clunio marinus TaxID=568069 RepID=A0A1J1ITQ1_9DIPT|nr:CLUMA_CG016308, isoform A [Clunio marinus]